MGGLFGTSIDVGWDVPGDDRVGVVLGTLGEPDVAIPVIGVSFALGEELYEADGARVSIDVETQSEIRQTENVIADTTTGRKNRTIVVGAHLDSVPEGPGINDNGSGTATNLETALQMAKLGIKPENRGRFAFWGAEEFNLLGSQHYVDSLSKNALDKIALNLNISTSICWARQTSCASSTTATARQPTIRTTLAPLVRAR
jgi:acetylornithine deacetylase/succinyl-diaminopimelate desuccinylase-like protein